MLRTAAAALALAACASPPAPLPDPPAAPAPAPPPDPLRRAAERDREALLPLLASADPGVRAQAVLGLGRLQDPGDAAPVLAALSDAAAEVRERAAEAAGLLGLSWDEPTAEQRAAMTRALAAAAVSEADPAVRARIAWSLGRAGGEGSGEALAPLLADASPAVRAQAGFSAGLVARFHAPADPAALSRAVLGLVGDADPSARAAAAFASIYLPAPDLARLRPLAADADPQVRAFAARALGVAGEEPARLEKLAADPEVRVRVEAVRGLQAIASRRGVPARQAARSLARLARALAESARTTPGPFHAQPLELVVRPVAGEVSRDTARAALEALGDPRTAAAPADAARLRCLAAAALARASRSPKHVPGCGAGLVPPALEERLEASVLGDLPGNEARLEELAGQGHPPAVRMAAIDALGRRAGSGSQLLGAALSDADPAVVAAAAGAVAARKEVALRPALVGALGLSGAEVATEAAQSILDALGTLGDDPASRAAATAALSDPRPAVRTSARRALLAMGAPVPAGTPAATRLNVPPPAPAAAPRRVNVTTARGSFTIELDDAAAPVAAESFRSLARLGFFDGLTFHRLEPGFVVQGGDPRGDGSGGPGWALPCENAATAYERGTVGMALSGKDTGGSQWFVTFGRTPHLEGRYTAFGRVVQGMEVVEALLAGDVMEKVALAP